MITRIEFFGDSIIRGALWADGKFRLRPGRDFATLAGTGVTVRNNAVIGSTILKGAQTVARRLPALDENTLVVLGFGGNDSDHVWQEVSDSPAAPHLPRVALQAFRERYAQVIRQIRATGATVALCSLVPLDAERYFAFISKDRDARHILQWLGDKEILYRWHENYNRAVERLAFAAGCPLIDLRDGFLARHDYERLIGPDGIHPTLEGYDVIDDIIFGEVRELCAAGTLGAAK